MKLLPPLLFVICATFVAAREVSGSWGSIVAWTTIIIVCCAVAAQDRADAARARNQMIADGKEIEARDRVARNRRLQEFDEIIKSAQVRQHAASPAAPHTH